MTWNFRIWTGCALILGFSLFHTSMSHGAEKRLAFKGVTLGMSMGEFRNLAFPDAGRPLDDGKAVPRAYRTNCRQHSDRIKVCWFEAWNEIRPPVCKLDAEGIKRHIRRINRNSKRKAGKEFTLAEVHNICFTRVDVGYGGRSPGIRSGISYYFHGGRLMEIDIYIRPLEIDDLYRKLVMAYGPPTKNSRPAVSNRFGARFQNLVAQWRSDGDVIILKRYDGRTDTGKFTFIHRPTVAQYRAGTARVARDAAKDF